MLLIARPDCLEGWVHPNALVVAGSMAQNLRLDLAEAS